MKTNVENEKENKEVENSKEGVEGIDVEEDGDGAVQHLIFHSFYPLTCMVPLGEDFITIKENTPELMKAKENDSLLQETIKTFQVLMQEKDDEILNLRRQLKDDNSAVVKMTSANIQTDLTLSACDEMERQLIALSAGLPDKVEKIHQLQLEKSRLQESLQEIESDKSKIIYLEEELSESLKNCLELEEINVNVGKENENLKRNCEELNWKLEEMNDLKVEVELAKIQTEDDMVKLKDSLLDKELLIQRLNDQLKNIDGIYEIDKNIQSNDDSKIKELERQLKEAEDNLKEIKQRKGTNEETLNELELNILIEKVKEKVLTSPSQGYLTELLREMLPQYSERFGSSDIDSIKELLTIASENETTTDELNGVVTILKAMKVQESGEIDKEYFLNCINDDTKQKYRSSKTKEELEQEALEIGLMVIAKETLLNSDIKFIKSEYMKLEVILNTLNRSYKTTHMTSLNKLSNIEMVEKILKLKEAIYNICMHEFWENIFDQPMKDKDISKGFHINTTDRLVVGTLIFPYFLKDSDHQKFLFTLINIHQILLLGEPSNISNKVSNILLMKMLAIKLCHDLCNHLIPLFPKEMRYGLLGKPFEGVIISDNKVIDKISEGFLSLLQDVNNSSDVSTIIFDIFKILNFEDELFSVSSKNSTSDYKMSKLSTSTITGKVENAIVSVNLNKNVKQSILSKIQLLENIMNGSKKRDLFEIYKLKSESELIKVLVDQKENLLKVMIIDSFHPAIDKLLQSKESTYLSSLSKEMVAVDYWIKMLLFNYYKNTLQNLNDLTLEEMEISLKRLNQALAIILPTYISREQDFPKTKYLLAAMISNQRTIILKHIYQYIFNNSRKIQFTQDLDEIVLRDEVNEITINKSYQTLKEIFSVPEIDKMKLENILHKLYEIDCEIYPGNFDQDMKKKIFSLISDVEIFDEILILRLSIAAYVMLPYEESSFEENNNSEKKRNFKILKEIETVLLQIDDEILDENIVSVETKQLKIIIEKLKQKSKIDNEKLHNCFLALKKIKCGLYNTNYDASKVSIEFNKSRDYKEKRLLVLNEAENLFNVLKLNSTSKNKKNNICDNYIKIEELLEDIEHQMGTDEIEGKGIWVYSVLSKTEEILHIASEKPPTKNKDKSLIREHIINNLDDIKVWTKEESNWRKSSFNRVNNLIKKLNSKIKNRKIEMSISDNSEFLGNFDDEKVAFENAFTQLENRFNDLTSTNEKSKNKINVIDLTKKTDDELRTIILTLEKEIDSGNWTKTDENEAKTWLSSRVREELIIDCNNLLKKSLMMKIDGMLTSEYKKERKIDRPNRENQITQFEDDINAKLSKYEELCETVEKLKVPQQQIIRKNNSANYLLDSENFSQAKNDTVSYDQPLSYRSTIRSHSNQLQPSQNDDDDIDLYFQRRIEELQRFIKFPNSLPILDKTSTFKMYGHNGTDVLVDGFDIEDEKTPRYYSMKLQDIQHERKEDEMGALLHHIEKHRMNLLAENQNLQQQLYISNNIQENQNTKILNLEKTEDILRQKLASFGTEDLFDSHKMMNSEEMQIMKHERQRLKSSLVSLQKKMDELNNENVSLSSSNVNFQQENHGLIIKNQCLERSIKKLETVYEDLMLQLEFYKNHSEQVDQDNSPNITDIQDYPTSDKLKINEKDKVELVKKLDIIDQQNKLLKKHCEKMNEEISSLNTKLTETKNKSDKYLKQNQQLTEVLDKMKIEKRKLETPSAINSLRNKEEEIKQLKTKILHLETRLVSSNEAPSGERLKQELIANKDREIMRLMEQLGTLQDRVDEIRAQLEVKDYENKKLHSLSKQLQNQINDNSYYPPPGYKIVKDH